MPQLNFLSDSQTLVSIDPSKNRYRIYSVEITKLRPYRVTTRWGRKTPNHRKPRWTGTKETEFESIQTALKIYESILNQKSQRGYNVSTASAL
jgi:predicted DNA-binding WGR domain protein